MIDEPEEGMPKFHYIVQPCPRGWEVRREHRSRANVVKPSRDQAVRTGLTLAARMGAHLIVREPDGGEARFNQHGEPLT